MWGHVWMTVWHCPAEILGAEGSDDEGEASDSSEGDDDDEDDEGWKAC